MADPADETTDEQPSDDDTPRGLRARIEEQAKARREAETKAKDLQRENVLLKSDLGHLNERQQKALFADIGEGDLTVEALQAAAKDLFGAAPANGASPATPAQTDETNEALGQMATFAAGGTSVEPPPPAKEAFVKEVQDFKGSREELFSLIFEQNAHLLDS